MNGKSVQKRLRARLHRAKLAVMHEGNSIRVAAARFHLPKSTLFDYIKSAPNPARIGRPPVLTDTEEQTVLDTLLYFSDHGVPLNRASVVEAITLLVSTFSAERRASVPFKDGVPGRAFMRSFVKRHRRTLKVCVPDYHEAKRHAAVNAVTLTEHIARVERLVELFHIDADRFWNLDETGSSPGRDAKGNSRQKRFMRRDGSHEARMPRYTQQSRVTLMPAVSAAGEIAPPLFVVKGKRLPFREVLVDGRVEVQTLAQMLPRGACLAMREEHGGVDATNFLSWAQQFVRSVADLTANGRHVLLTYDAYGAHMSLAVLLLLRAHRVVVYALPAHTSGRTQPLDVVAFGMFKRELNVALNSALLTQQHEQLDTFEFCRIMTHVFHKSFTRKNIVASFQRSGLWPINTHRLLSAPLPRDAGALEDILSPSELIVMLEQKRTEVRKSIFGAHVSVLRHGYVDTTRGAVLTSDKALQIAQVKAIADKERRDNERLAAERRSIRDAALRDRRKKNRLQLERLVAERRAAAAGMTVDVYRAQLRSLKSRRAIARLRALEKRKSAHRNDHHVPSTLVRVRSAECTKTLDLLADLACAST